MSAPTTSGFNSIFGQTGRRDARLKAAPTPSRAGLDSPCCGRVSLDDASQRDYGHEVRPRPRRPPGGRERPGGAAGMQIMDQRVTSTSAVRCVGNTLILQGVVCSPPSTITAVGIRDGCGPRSTAPRRQRRASATFANTGSAIRPGRRSSQ
ncbi:DUF881 domain-containing protein [Spirillospora sp. NPDC048911]|uniref:DUF881 domain-containing protein n=1 Tax=Spirillospora sp. NPDC048911 TaxID=3364527 RepID=UPI003710CD9D